MAAAMVVRGKGLFVLYASKLPADAVRVALDHGIDWVVVKSADGPRIWDREFQAPAVAALRDAGVRIFSWQYVYGQNPAGEASAADWALQNGSEVHVLDIEGEFEHNPVALRALLQACAAQGIQRQQLGYSSYGVEGYHAIDWTQLHGSCGTAWPQAYYATQSWTAEYSLSLTQAGLAGYDGQVVAIGDTYGGATEDSTKRFASRAAQLFGPAVGLWEWSQVAAAVWAGIKEASLAPAPPAYMPLDGVTMLPSGDWLVSRAWRDRAVSLASAAGEATYDHPGQPMNLSVTQRNVQMIKRMLGADGVWDPNVFA
jgi:hypothetical protein